MILTQEGAAYLFLCQTISQGLVFVHRSGNVFGQKFAMVITVNLEISNHNKRIELY